MIQLKNTGLSAMALLLFMASCIGQPFPILNFRNITEKEGLSNNEVSGITQDKNGIIWIATTNGLNRYDGKHIKVFYASIADSNQLYFNFIASITASGEDGLWVLGNNAVQYMDINTEKISTLSSNLMRPKLFEKNGTPFIIDQNGIYSYKNGVFKKDNRSTMKPFNVWGKEYRMYNNIVWDRQQNPWAFVHNRIFKFNKDFSKLVKQFILPENIVTQDIYFDHTGRCWVATWARGILILDTETGKFRLVNNTLNNLTTISFGAWKIHGKNYIVACNTEKAPLIFFDEETLAHQTYLTNNPCIARNSFTDRDNNLWISTNDGIKLVSAAPALYETIPVFVPDEPIPYKGALGGVYNVKELSDGYWLTKRYHGGVFHYSKNWEFLQHWPYLESVNTDRYKKFGLKTEGYDFKEYGKYRYITTESGLMLMNKETGESLLIYPDNDSIVPRLRNISPETETRWWIRSFNKGLYLFDAAGNRFIKHYPIKNEQQSNLNANFTIFTSRKEIFATTYEGLYKLNQQVNMFEKLDVPGFNLVTMLGMAEDKNGLLWIATEKGLLAYQPAENKIIKTFPEYNDMGSCSRVCTDNYNNIWFNCMQGYWCWIQDKQQMVKFGYNMGLPDNRVEASFNTDSNGYVYGGASDAVVKFNPKALLNYSVHPKAIITDVMANAAKIAGQWVNDSTQRVELPPGLYAIDINFSVTEYSTPGNNVLYYRVNNTGKWNISEHGNIGFTNLSHGDYFIEVKGKNNLTSEYSKPHFLQLTIWPHWYQTDFFKLLLVLFSVGMLYFIYRVRLKNIRKNARLKQHMAETEMQALRAQMNPHFIFNSLNSIENFIMQNEKRLASDYLNKFSRLMRSILDSSKNEMVPFEKDMEALKLYVELEQLRFNNKFTYSTQYDPELVNKNYKVPSLLVQPYVENAIIHGFARIKKTGLHLDVTAAIKDGYIEYTVRDNGAGRAHAAAYNELNHPGHKSVGLSITEDRLRHFNENSIPVPVAFTDLHDTEGKALGTLVTIKLKIR